MRLFKALASNTSYPIYVIASDIETALRVIASKRLGPVPEPFAVTELKQISETAAHVFAAKEEAA